MARKKRGAIGDEKKPATPIIALPKRIGRPRNIDFTDPATLAYVKDLAAIGLNQRQIGACVGYSEAEFSRQKKEFPQLNQALKEGFADGLAFVAHCLRLQIAAQTPASTIFYLKAKGGWRDNAVEPDDRGADGDSGSPGRRVLDNIRKSRRR